MNRAYSLLEIKAVREEDRIIEGIATTPTPDRVGDIIESAGAEFSLPIPFLWQHNTREPIGHVLEAKVTKRGIEVKAQIIKVEEPGKLKDRVDEAWQSIKLKLVRGLSIGFKGLEMSRIEDSNEFGVRFIKWLWLELSAVTIAANAEASITAIKTIDTEQLAALGHKTGGSVRLITPPVAGTLPPKSPKEGNKMSTLAEQITALEATRAAKAARMEEVTKRSLDSGETMNDDEKEEFDTLEKEIDNIDSDLKRLRTLERMKAHQAQPVPKVANAIEPTPVQPSGTVIVREPKLPPGIGMVRAIKCLFLAQGNRWGAAQIADQIYKDHVAVGLYLKATVAAGATVAGNWAVDLIGDETGLAADFVEFLRPQTILGKFGNNGIPSLRSVPFRVPLISQTSGGTGYWVGEGKAKPLTSFDFDRTTLEPLKVAAIVAATEELLRYASINAELTFRTELVNALRERMDLDFINPDKVAVSGISPAGILNGITAIASSGNTADDVRADINAIMGAYIDANNPPTTGVWVMSARLAQRLGSMRNPLGQPEFPNINMNGGTLEGLPVITSEYVTPNTTGDFVALINASDIYLGDEGGFRVDMSREASLEMSDAPAHDSTTPTAAQLVSMWQTNSVAIRAERIINWARRRSSGVAWLSNVNWGAGS